MNSTLETYAEDQASDPQPQYTWPESELYISEKHRLIYCPIQKVACSSLKLWWAELAEGSSAQFLQTDHRGKKWVDHFTLNERYKLLHYQPANQTLQPLTDEAWFRIVFVRNPWARLVSAYLNKFLLCDDIIMPVFNEAQLRWGHLDLSSIPKRIRRLFSWNKKAEEEFLRLSIWPRLYGKKAWQDEFTFRHFVEFIAASDLEGDDIDLHWRPQYRFLGDVKFHFVGRFEQLDTDFRTLVERLGLHSELPAFNRTTYKRQKRSGPSFADCPLKQIRRLTKAPDYRQFYTPRLQAQVADLYRRDIEQFGYEFDEWREEVVNTAA